MTDKATHQLLKMAVAQTLKPLGWHSMNASACDVLTDILGSYMLTVAKTTAAYSSHGRYLSACSKTVKQATCLSVPPSLTANRTDPNLTDLNCAFRDLGISVSKLSEFRMEVDSTPLKHHVANFPLKKPSTHVYQPSSASVTGSTGLSSRKVSRMSRSSSLTSEEEEDDYIPSYLPPLPSTKGDEKGIWSFRHVPFLGLYHYDS